MIRILAGAVIATALVAAPALAQNNMTSPTTVTTKKTDTKMTSKSANGAKKSYHKKAMHSTNGASKVEMSSSTEPAKK